MSVRSWLAARVRRSTVVYECRRCGTTLSAVDDRCPHCDADDVAVYDLA